MPERPQNLESWIKSSLVPALWGYFRPEILKLSRKFADYIPERFRTETWARLLALGAQVLERYPTKPLFGAINIPEFASDFLEAVSDSIKKAIKPEEKEKVEPLLKELLQIKEDFIKQHKEELSEIFTRLKELKRERLEEILKKLKAGEEIDFGPIKNLINLEVELTKEFFTQIINFAQELEKTTRKPEEKPKVDWDKIKEEMKNFFDNLKPKIKAVLEKSKEDLKKIDKKAEELAQKIEEIRKNKKKWSLW